MDDCVFCRIVTGELPAAFVYTDDAVLAIMDRYPATRGHVLILPRRHVEDLYGLPSELAHPLMDVLLRVARSIQRALRPDGLNVIQSNGAAAGQTVNHLHFHLVPRYAADSLTLHFGHGRVPADLSELTALAERIRAI